MVEFVLAVVLLSIVFLLVKFIVAVPGGLGPVKLDVKLNATSTSRVCSHDLINLLRATDEESGLEYAQLLALDSDDFQSKAYDYFNDSFKRGYITQQDWKLIVTKDTTPIVTVGPLEEIPITKSCTQYVPSLTPGQYYVVKLGTEY
ncbi:hypothetical protein GF374_02840 [Candidatus Woesearchaeota archaeon]|nr:hypothetical protein [Candidatus Woesearchaeota archaeon]